MGRGVSDLPYPDNPGSTHYEGCWRDRGHHNCAVREIERLHEIILELERARRMEREGDDSVVA